jgi:PBP1b-binding outer membrane lipoprotein LpoB
MSRKNKTKSLFSRLFLPLLLLFGCGIGLIYVYITGDLEVTPETETEIEKNFTKFQLCKYIVTHDVDAIKNDSNLVVFERPKFVTKTVTIVDTVKNTVEVVDSVKVNAVDISKINPK